MRLQIMEDAFFFFAKYSTPVGISQFANRQNWKEKGKKLRDFV